MYTSKQLRLSAQTFKNFVRQIKTDAELISSININRLKILSEYLKVEVCKNQAHFLMDEWFCKDGVVITTPQDFVKVRRDLTRPGITACAAGWAAMIPNFRKIGFKPGSSPINQYNVVKCDDVKQGNNRVLTGFNAIEYFFNIPAEYADWIFLKNAYINHYIKPVTVTDVINRIDYLIDNIRQLRSN